MNHDINTDAPDRVDAVYTWVDGSEPAHKEKRLRYIRETERGSSISGSLETRWGDSGELLLSIYALRKFAPWVSRIFLVTDSQRPFWLTEEARKDLGITLVDHTEIFFGLEDRLPTFNSRSIESLLFRIPGLANRFLYLNDDFMIVNNTTMDDFFLSCGAPIYRGYWCPLEKRRKGWLSKKVKQVKESLRNHLAQANDTFTAAQRRSARQAGFEDSFFRLSHTPFPLLRNDFEAAISQDNILEKNTRFRFRNRRQLAPISLVAHTLLNHNRAVFRDDRDQIYLNAGTLSEDEAIRFKKTIENTSYKILCIQSLDECPESSREIILDTLSNHAALPESMKPHLGKAKAHPQGSP